ncbi:hypothetical protein ILUMI_09808 [Ignelater luminosus]|uniref:THAP-type domain-containing protein n=1 Tax=Ignelater luminosus TaxID=2038154 RepID=A0A8K0GE70_IGNLU|nr:hypothetical protein ILUMI_09808 [Ignelater luminosus]
MGYKLCIVCKSTSRDETLNFHEHDIIVILLCRFPKDKYRQRAWIDACKLEECQLKASSTICSKHFSELDYNSTIIARRRLHKEAVPSLNINNKDEKMEVDSGPSCSVIQPNAQSSIIDTNISSSTNSRNQDEGIKQLPENTKSSLSPKTPRYVGDLRPDHFSTPRKAKHNLEFVKQVVTQQRKKCKILNEDKKKLEKQILSLKDLVKQDKNVIINLVMDEMSIRELVEYSNGRYYGYVDLGMGSEHDGDHDNKDEAKSAFVFMGVSLGSYWKLPLGYFLIKSLTGPERANLLKKCLQLIEESGAQCRSITFDGAAVNIAMCNELGTQKILYDPNGNPIEWKYIESIKKLQAREGLRAGTKLTARHINFQNEKMKVSLAVQTLSRSVSSVLLFCKELNIEGFQNCQATANFCLVMNDVFDILNAKHLASKRELNRGLCSRNFELIKEKVKVYIDYLSKIRDNHGKLIIESNRKTV